MKRFMHRLFFVIKSRLPQKDTDWVKEVETHLGILEKQLNNVSVSLSKFRAHESVVRSDREAVLVKIDKVSRKLAEDKDGVGEEQLIELQRQYETEAVELKEKLAGLEKRRAVMQSSYQELRAAIQKVGVKLEEARARYYSAEARHCLYSDASGVANADGTSKMDRLFDRIKSMEADAEACYELSPLDMRIDREVK